MLRFLTIALALAALIGAAVYLVPRCGPAEPTGFRLGGMLIAGCKQDKRDVGDK